MEVFIQAIINGILLGGLYSAIALGMSTTFGIVKIVNLAHGDLLILGSYLSLVFVGWMGINPLVSIPLILPFMFLVGFCFQKFLLNRVLGEAMEPPLLVAFGVAVIMQNLLLLIFTPDARSLPTELGLANISLPGGLSIPSIYLVDFLIGAFLILALYGFFKFSYIGRAIRAAADDEIGASLMGVNTSNIYSYAMGIAIATAGIAGVLVGMTFNFYPHSGSQYLIIAFGVIIIGGLGSMKGTLIGGIILGLAQLLGSYFFGAGYQLLSGYVVLLIVLGLRPQGLFSKI